MGQCREVWGDTGNAGDVRMLGDVRRHGDAKGCRVYSKDVVRLWGCRDVGDIERMQWAAGGCDDMWGDTEAAGMQGI